MQNSSSVIPTLPSITTDNTSTVPTTITFPYVDTTADPGWAVVPSTNLNWEGYPELTTKRITVLFPDGGVDKMEVPLRFIGDTYYWSKDGTLYPIEALKKRADEGDKEAIDGVARVSAWKMTQ